jgi:hypothetical protein
MKLTATPYGMGSMRYFRSHHQAQYSTVGACFTYAFSLPPNCDIYKLADKLLDAGVADGATMPPSTTVRVAKRRSKALDLRNMIRDIASIVDIADGKVTASKWILNNRRAAIFSIRRLGLRINPFAKKPSEISAETRESLEKLRKKVKEIDASIEDETDLLGVIAATDDLLFSPIYLRKSPFVRLQLMPFGATSSLLADETIYPILLLHRSGIALLTFYTVVGSGRTYNEVLRASVSTATRFTSATFPLTVVGVAPFSDEYAVGRDELLPADEKVPTHRRIEPADHFGIPDAFFLYRDRIKGLVGTRDSGIADYFCYGTLAIDGIGCCRSKDAWLKAHSSELAGLIMRTESHRDLSESAVSNTLKGDHSIQRGRSSYFNGGNAVTIRWGSSGDEPAPSFVSLVDTIAVIENAVLQYWQIQELDSRLDLIGGTTGTLSRVQLRLAEGISEHRTSTISFGTAHDIAASILEKLHATDLHQRMLDRLAMNQQLIETRKADASVRRNYLIAGIGSFATVLLGIPAIRDSLAAIAQWKPPHAIAPATKPLIEWAKQGSEVVIPTYLGFLILAALLLIAGFVRSPKRRARSQSVGLEWSATLWTRQRPVSAETSDQDAK